MIPHPADDNNEADASPNTPLLLQGCGEEIASGPASTRGAALLRHVLSEEGNTASGGHQWVQIFELDDDDADEARSGLTTTVLRASRGGGSGPGIPNAGPGIPNTGPGIPNVGSGIPNLGGRHLSSAGRINSLTGMVNYYNYYNTAPAIMQAHDALGGTDDMTTAAVMSGGGDSSGSDDDLSHDPTTSSSTQKKNQQLLTEQLRKANERR
eukprot:9286994-Pyramimonas_sp.AAC.1